jgi:hypothetical protein
LPRRENSFLQALSAQFFLVLLPPLPITNVTLQVAGFHLAGDIEDGLRPGLPARLQFCQVVKMGVSGLDVGTVAASREIHQIAKRFVGNIHGCFHAP